MEAAALEQAAGRDEVNRRAWSRGLGFYACVASLATLDVLPSLNKSY
jgi:hypothetical protein